MKAEDRHRALQHRSVLPGVEAVTPSTDRSVPRHSHDRLGFGVVAFGTHRSWSGVGTVAPSSARSEREWTAAHGISESAHRRPR